jgi:hypothetical protein
MHEKIGDGAVKNRFQICRSHSRAGAGPVTVTQLTYLLVTPF